MRIFNPEADRSKGYKIFEIFLGIVCALLIVAILVGFLVPILFQDRGPHRTACISNLKQLITSVAIYEADYEDNTPPFFTFESTEKDKAFFASIDEYSKNHQIFRCPLDKDTISTIVVKPGHE